MPPEPSLDPFTLSPGPKVSHHFGIRIPLTLIHPQILPPLGRTLLLLWPDLITFVYILAPSILLKGLQNSGHIWVIACLSCLSPPQCPSSRVQLKKKIPSGHPLQWPPLIYSITQREARCWGRTKRGSGQHFLGQSCPCSMSRELKATLPFLLRSQKRLEPAKVFLSQDLGKDSGMPQRRR